VEAKRPSPLMSLDTVASPDPEQEIAAIRRRTDRAFKLYLAWWLLICLLLLAAICSGVK
jgi:hypothetical protein